MPCPRRNGSHARRLAARSVGAVARWLALPTGEWGVNFSFRRPGHPHTQHTAERERPTGSFGRLRRWAGMGGGGGWRAARPCMRCSRTLIDHRPMPRELSTQIQLARSAAADCWQAACPQMCVGRPLGRRWESRRRSPSGHRRRRLSQRACSSCAAAAACHALQLPACAAPEAPTQESARRSHKTAFCRFCGPDAPGRSSDRVDTQWAPCRSSTASWRAKPRCWRTTQPTPATSPPSRCRWGRGEAGDPAWRNRSPQREAAPPAAADALLPPAARCLRASLSPQALEKGAQGANTKFTYSCDGHSECQCCCCC